MISDTSCEDVRLVHGQDRIPSTHGRLGTILQPHPAESPHSTHRAARHAPVERGAPLFTPICLFVPRSSHQVEIPKQHAPNGTDDENCYRRLHVSESDQNYVRHNSCEHRQCSQNRLRMFLSSQPSNSPHLVEPFRRLHLYIFALHSVESSRLHWTHRSVSHHSFECVHSVPDANPSGNKSRH